MSRPLARGPYAARLDYFRQVLARYHCTPAGSRRLLEVTRGDESLGSAFRRQGLRVTTISSSAGWPRAKLQEFDVVCCCDLLDERRRSLVLVSQVAGSLRPGGLLLYGSVRRRSGGAWLTRTHLLSPAELERVLRREGLGPGQLVRLEDGRAGLEAYAACAVRILGTAPEPTGGWCYDPVTARWTFLPGAATARDTDPNPLSAPELAD